MYSQNNNIEYVTNTEYSKLVWWEIYNFMSIPYAKCEFDEKGIINIKGYNDSGKSNVIRALDVLLNNRYPTTQVKFIRDDMEFFEVSACFSDGVIVRKIKYANGKGLYEMYKDGQVIFTTKQNGILTQISGVPQIIQDYLGLISNDDIFLNSRACYEKQLLVETTGSENYKFLNTILHSEELALASKLLNTDKNAVLAEKTKLEYEIQSDKKQIEGLKDITVELIDALTSHDRNLDLCEAKLESLEVLIESINRNAEIPVFPTLDSIDITKLDALDKLVELKDKIDSIQILPKLDVINTEKLDLLSSLANILDVLSSIQTHEPLKSIDLTKINEIEHLLSLNNEIKSIVISPKLNTINSDILNDVLNLSSIYESIDRIDKDIESTNSQLVSKKQELEELSHELQVALASDGIKTVKCTNCGEILEVV